MLFSNVRSTEKVLLNSWLNELVGRYWSKYKFSDLTKKLTWSNQIQKMFSNVFIDNLEYQDMIIFSSIMNWKIYNSGIYF